MQDYDSCLADYAAILPALAGALRADLVDGAYEEAEERFHRSGRSTEIWTLTGTEGSLEIRFERYEGYYFARLTGNADAVARARVLLAEAERQQGGGPDELA